MNKCKQCTAVVNPKWQKCLVCDSPLGRNPDQNTVNHEHITSMPLDEFTKNKLAIKVFSKLLGEEIWIVSNEEMKNKVADEGLPIYLPLELEHLIKIRAEPEELKKIHLAKTVFQGSSIVLSQILKEKN